jgi:hypothetical protein
MGFSRVLVSTGPEGAEALTSDMVAIGMNFAAVSSDQPDTDQPKIGQPNIEDTLLFASIEGMEKHDLRVLAVLVTWFGIHSAWVNADRLTMLAGLNKSRRVRALWSALARWQEKDRRFARLARLYRGPRLDLMETGTEFQIKRHGEDPRLQGSAIRVAANVLRDRPADVLSPAELARRHHAYRWRVVIGPGYRADMWAALEEDGSLSATVLAKKTYGSFATAWRVRRDFGLLTRMAGASGSAKSA